MKKEQVKEAPQADAKDYAGMEAKLKKLHGELTKIEFKLKDEMLVAYLRQPDLIELDATMTSIASAPISSSVGLFKTLFVGGDDELLKRCQETGIALAISTQIQKTIPLVFSQSTSI